MLTAESQRPVRGKGVGKQDGGFGEKEALLALRTRRAEDSFGGGTGRITPAFVDIGVLAITT